MCPELQLFSIYVDGELPSPWKERLEAHIGQCSDCSEKLENYKRLQALFKKDTHQRRAIVDKSLTDAAGHSQEFLAEPESDEPEYIKRTQEKVWKKLEERSFKTRRFRADGSPYAGNLWHRRFYIPLPVAAAAALILVFLAALWVRGNFTQQQPDINSKANVILAAEDDLPEIIPAADINDVLQLLGSTGSDILIMRLPESRNFSRSGEPAIINATDYSRRRP